MNSMLIKMSIATAFVNADETIEHVNNVLFFSNIFFIGLDIILFFVPIYILSKIIRHRKTQSESDVKQESRIFETEQKLDTNDSDYFDSPFEK